MTHEFKHKVDLSQFGGAPTDDLWEYIVDDSMYDPEKDCGMVPVVTVNGFIVAEGTSMEYADKIKIMSATPKLLAYARELEERVAKMQEAGDNMEQWLGFDIDYDSKAIDVVAEAWRNA